MTTKTDLLKEIMERYTENRTRWIAENGNDEGFDKWFTNQVIRK